MPFEILLEKIRANSYLAAPFLIAIAIGSVVAIAGGFIATYHALIWIGCT